MEEIGKITKIVNESVIYDAMPPEDADKIIELLEKVKSKCVISNVIGICKSTRVSDGECLSGCGVEYEPMSGFKYCPYCGNELELIF